MMLATAGMLAVVLLFPGSGCSQAESLTANVQKAEMLYDHGMIEDAKKELVNVVFGDSDKDEKAEALFFLGNIAFTEEKIPVALETWERLIEKYPNSKQAVLVKDRASELAEVVGETASEKISHVVAQSYLRNGDFWSEHEDDVFEIDSSSINNVGAAMKWYDKVLAEFPLSPAAELAYTKKLKILVAWAKSGGPNFTRYMPRLLETFSSFEADFPQAGTLQGFRFQIAQTYYRNHRGVEGFPNLEKSREWLNRIISVAGDSDSFYKDLAQRRLKKITY